MRLPKPLHETLHAIGFIGALIGVMADGTVVAPWICLATYGLGLASHRWKSFGEADFGGIVRTSLAIVAVLVSAGQHWVVQASGLEFVILAIASLALEALRPLPTQP